LVVGAYQTKNQRLIDYFKSSRKFLFVFGTILILAFSLVDKFFSVAGILDVAPVFRGFGFVLWSWAIVIYGRYIFIIPAVIALLVLTTRHDAFEFVIIFLITYCLFEVRSERFFKNVKIFSISVISAVSVMYIGQLFKLQKYGVAIDGVYRAEWLIEKIVRRLFLIGARTQNVIFEEYVNTGVFLSGQASFRRIYEIFGTVEEKFGRILCYKVTGSSTCYDPPGLVGALSADFGAFFGVFGLFLTAFAVGYFVTRALASVNVWIATLLFWRYLCLK
jgi:hypothetical protein